MLRSPACRTPASEAENYFIISTRSRPHTYEKKNYNLTIFFFFFPHVTEVIWPLGGTVTFQQTHGVIYTF